jgi:hypothetical protein
MIIKQEADPSRSSGVNFFGGLFLSTLLSLAEPATINMDGILSPFLEAVMRF